MVRLALLGVDEAERAAWVAAARRLADVGVSATTPRELPTADSEAVILGASHDDVARTATVAAESGKHVLVDLAALGGTSDFEALCAVCCDHRVVLKVATPLRFLPSVEAIKQSVEGGQLGTPGLLRIHRWVTNLTGDAFGWLVHEIDLANWLFGHRPTQVYAVSRDAAGPYLQVHLGFPEGGMSLIDVAATLPGGDYYSLSLIGGDGAAYADDHHNMHLVYRGSQPAAVRGDPGVTHLVALLREFLAAIRDRRDPFPSLPPRAGEGEGGEADAGVLSALGVVDAVRRAIEAGKALRLGAGGDGYEFC